METTDLLPYIVAWFQGFLVGFALACIWYYRRLMAILKELEKEEDNGLEV